MSDYQAGLDWPSGVPGNARWAGRPFWADEVYLRFTFLLFFLMDPARPSPVTQPRAEVRSFPLGRAGCQLNLKVQ